MNNELSTPITRRQALKAAGGAGAMLGIGALAGPASAIAKSARPASALTKVTDQLGWEKTSQWAGFYAAIENGYYKKMGIDEDLIAGGPDIVASDVVGAGHAMVGEDDNQTALQAIAKGEPNIIYGTLYQRSPYSIISLPSDPIKTLKDFAGKTIAISPATEAYLNPVLTKAGVSLSSVKYVPADNVAQLANKEVQGYFGFSTNEAIELKNQGVPVVVVSNWDLGMKSYGNVLITTKSFLEKNKPLLVNYLKATIMGWEYAIKHPQEMGELTVKKFAAPGDNLKDEVGQAIAQVSLIKNPSGIMKITYPNMQQVIDQMVTAKALTKPLKAQDVMTTEILDAAYGGKTYLPL